MWIYVFGLVVLVYYHFGSVAFISPVLLSSTTTDPQNRNPKHNHWLLSFGDINTEWRRRRRRIIVPSFLDTPNCWSRSSEFRLSLSQIVLLTSPWSVSFLSLSALHPTTTLHLSQTFNFTLYLGFLVVDFLLLVLLKSRASSPSVFAPANFETGVSGC